MADVYRRLIACDFVEFFVNLGLGDGIERGGRLIQADKGRILIQRAGNGNLLRLAARNLHAILLQILIQADVQPLGHFLQPLFKARQLQAFAHALRVVMRARGRIVALSDIIRIASG